MIWHCFGGISFFMHLVKDGNLLILEARLVLGGMVS